METQEINADEYRELFNKIIDVIPKNTHGSLTVPVLIEIIIRMLKHYGNDKKVIDKYIANVASIIFELLAQEEVNVKDSKDDNISNTKRFWPL